ncbi:hypothetical protein ACLOJK_028424 [Asimina triloba]
MVLHHLPQSGPSASPTTDDPRRPRRPAAAADDRSAPFAHLATGQQLEPPSPAACITPTSRTHPSHAGQQSAIAAPPPATPDRNRNNSPIQSPLSFFSNAGKPSTHLHHAHEQNPSRPNQAGSPHFSVRHHGPAGYICRPPRSSNDPTPHPIQRRMTAPIGNPSHHPASSLASNEPIHPTPAAAVHLLRRRPAQIQPSATVTRRRPSAHEPAAVRTPFHRQAKTQIVSSDATDPASPITPTPPSPPFSG